MYTANLEHIKNTFKGLEFVEETHTYYVEGQALKKSVSGVIKDYVEEVDFELKAKEIDGRKGLPEGTTSTMWRYNSELSCAKGTKAHYFGEIYAFHRSIKPTDGLEEAIVKFYEELPSNIIVVDVELCMYHKELMIGGMADILLFDTNTGLYHIADWKSNADLFKNFRGKKLLAPFNNLLDNSFNKYQMQFSFYQVMFEQTGFKVGSRKLIHIKPDGTYEWYDTEDLTGVMREKLNW